MSESVRWPAADAAFTAFVKERGAEFPPDGDPDSGGRIGNQFTCYTVDRTLEGAPPIKIRDTDFWQGWKDHAIGTPRWVVMLDYAERWARLMQVEIARDTEMKKAITAAQRVVNEKGNSRAIANALGNKSLDVEVMVHKTAALANAGRDGIERVSEDDASGARNILFRAWSRGAILHAVISHPIPTAGHEHGRSYYRPLGSDQAGGTRQSLRAGWPVVAKPGINCELR